MGTSPPGTVPGKISLPLNPLYFTILSVPAKERASANISRSLDNSPGIGLLERHTSGGMFMTNAARHCQWAAAMGAATPDSALRDSQSYWFRECADACASAALTLFHTGHLPPEEALAAPAFAGGAPGNVRSAGIRTPDTGHRSFNRRPRRTGTGPEGNPSTSGIMGENPLSSTSIGQPGEIARFAPPCGRDRICRSP